MPQNNVKALLQTRAGYLWVGTLMGLARFDGLNFRVFTHTDTPGLISDTVGALAEDDNGTLWVGTQKGLIEWQNGESRLWNFEHGFPSKGNGIQQLQIHPRGGLWFRQGNSVGHFHNQRAKLYSGEEGLVSDSGRHFYHTRPGGIMVSSRRGLQRLEPDMERFTDLQPWPLQSDLWCILEDSNDALWAGCEAGLFRLEEGRWVSRSAAYGLEGQWVTRLYQFGAGTVWVGTKQTGLHFLQGNRFEPISPPDGHWHDIGVACGDSEGNVWVGTGGGGLLRLRPTKIKSWNQADGLPHDDVRTLCASADGSVWAGTELGLARIHNNRVDTFPNSRPGPRQHMGAVAVDASGAVWVSKFGEGRGVFRFDGQKYERVRHPALPTNHVHSFHLDRWGRLWMAGRGSVTYYSNGVFGPKLQGADFKSDVMSLHVDQQGALWAGVAGLGLKRCVDARIDTFTTKDGLCDDRPIFIHEDAEGILWIGSESGLSRIKQGRITALTTQDGLNENVINQILEDEFGYFWLGGLRGIHRVRREELNARAEGRIERVRCLNYAEGDGMATSETNGERQPCGARTADGRLWFASMGGVIEIDPRQMGVKLAGPKVTIEQVQSTGGLVSQSGIATRAFAPAPLRLPPGSGRVLGVHYTAPNLTAAERIQFRYRLEPTDPDWHDAGEQRMALYTNLRPGSYRFKVKASDPHGVWGDDVTTLAFILAPRFYERRSVQAAAIVLLVVAVLLIHQWRVRVIRRYNKLQQQQELVLERARIAEDLHDDLGANLTGLALKAELTRRQQLHPEQLAVHLADLVTTARGLSESMREVIWLANPRHDTLEAWPINWRAWRKSWPAMPACASASTFLPPCRTSPFRPGPVISFAWRLRKPCTTRLNTPAPPSSDWASAFLSPNSI